MPSGRFWTKDEIERLALAAREGSSPQKVADQLDRTPEAVMSKAQKLRLKLHYGAHH